MQVQVDINENVDRFTPGAHGCRKGVKFIFENERYKVVADMPAGYLRIFDKKRRIYLMPDGEACSDRNRTHFKIKKRGEM